MNFDTEKIAKVLSEEYALHVESIARLSGFYDGNFEIHSEEKKYFVKIFEVDALPSIIFQIDFIQTLIGSGLPVAKIRAAKNGEFFFCYEETFGILQEFLSGDHLYGTPLTDNLLHDIGEKLALLHTATSDKQLKGEASKAYPWDLAQFDIVKNDYTEAKQYIENDTQSILEQIFEEWDTSKAHLYAKLEKGYIHNDFHGYNILVKENKCSGIMDFGDAIVSWYAADIAIALIHICFQDARRIPESIRAFLGGYTHIKPLGSIQAEDILLLMKLRAATIIIEFDLHFNGQPVGIYETMQKNIIRHLLYLETPEQKKNMLTIFSHFHD